MLFTHIITLLRKKIKTWLVSPERPACNLIKKETLAQVFSCGFCEISQNSFFYRTPLVAASVLFRVGLPWRLFFDKRYSRFFLFLLNIITLSLNAKSCFRKIKVKIVVLRSQLKISILIVNHKRLIRKRFLHDNIYDT